MTQFESLFGIKSSQVKKNCILLPLFKKGILSKFKIKNWAKGRLYAIGNNNDFTLIHSGMGACMAGDAVLYLEETACRNIILFGSCGLVHKKSGLSIGSLVSPFKCYSGESFSELLLERNKELKVFYPSKNLLENFLKFDKSAGIKEVTCLTISSLKIEEEGADLFIERGIDVLDMECSAFFSAAGYTGINAIALFYITDIIKERPFYMNLDSALKSTLSYSAKKGAGLLCEFIKKNLNG